MKQCAPEERYSSFLWPICSGVIKVKQWDSERMKWDGEKIKMG